MSARRHKSESGYALLFVFAMAAMAAIMLYSQLPRAAFEAQRDKEQLLVDRGQQYSRAIQLFVRKYNRFPPDMDALENTQNIRFLRHKYKDPMTGKDEWRIIHVGPGGVFTDSLVYGNKKKDQNGPQTFITELQQVGGNGGAPNEGVNLASRRRPSDQAGAPGDPNNPAGNNPGGNDPNGQPGQQNGQPGGFPGNPGGVNGPVMVLPDGRIVPANMSGTPGATGVPGVPGQPLPGFPGQFPGANGAGGPQPGFGQPNFGQPNSSPSVPGQPGFGQGLPNGFQNQPNGPSPAAANLINQLLTTPRPGGMNGLAGAQGTDASGNNTGQPIGGAPGGQVIGGGIGGVASKLEQEGIKIFNERKAYNEWEFVYDMTKDASRGGRGGAMQAQPSPVNGAPGGIPGSIPGGIVPGPGTQR